MPELSLNGGEFPIDTVGSISEGRTICRGISRTTVRKIARMGREIKLEMERGDIPSLAHLGRASNYNGSIETCIHLDLLDTPVASSLARFSLPFFLSSNNRPAGVNIATPIDSGFHSEE